MPTRDASTRSPQLPAATPRPPSPRTPIPGIRSGPGATAAPSTSATQPGPSGAATPHPSATPLDPHTSATRPGPSGAITPRPSATRLSPHTSTTPSHPRAAPSAAVPGRRTTATPSPKPAAGTTKPLPHATSSPAPTSARNIPGSPPTTPPSPSPRSPTASGPLPGARTSVPTQRARGPLPTARVTPRGPTPLTTATTTDGLVHRRRALARGVSGNRIATALRLGPLRRILRGCHHHRGIRPTPRLRARAALLAAGTRAAVASHHTAARLHGLSLPPGLSPGHVTVPRSHRHLRRQDLIGHTRVLPPGHLTEVEGIPCTTLPRTVLDLARLLPRLAAVWLVEDALHRRPVTRADLDACLAELPRAPGDRELRARLAAATGSATTFLQCAARIALTEAGLPLFIPSYDLTANGVTLCTADGAYPEHRLALEFRDTPRAPHWRWLPLGWHLKAFSWRDLVHEPARFTTAVHEHLSAHGLPG